MPQRLTPGRWARFPQAKLRPPAGIVARPALHRVLTAGADRRLTVVGGSAGVGKSVLLADWAAARSPGTTAWLFCDGADAEAVRFWSGFIEASRAIEPAFGADAADMLGSWPSGWVQLVLSGRVNPPLRQHRLRMRNELNEIHDRDLYFSLPESQHPTWSLSACV